MSVPTRQTVHTLLHDVPNPTHAFRDRRRSERWQDQEVFKKGMRLVLIRRDMCQELHTTLPEGDRADLVAIAPDLSGGDYDGSHTGHNDMPVCREYFRKGQDVADVRFHHQRTVDSEHSTSKERAEAEVYIAFHKALLAALSAPVTDYRATFLRARGWGTHSEAEVLHHLFLLGKISLQDIRDAITDIENKKD